MSDSKDREGFTYAEEANEQVETTATDHCRVAKARQQLSTDGQSEGHEGEYTSGTVVDVAVDVWLDCGRTLHQGMDKLSSNRDGRVR